MGGILSKISYAVAVMVLFVLLSFFAHALQFEITEIGANPSSGYEYVELFANNFSYSNITIGDYNSNETISSNATDRIENYSGYILITTNSTYYENMVTAHGTAVNNTNGSSQSNYSCIMLNVSGYIGNGLSNSGDFAFVTIENITRNATFGKSTKGMSFNLNYSNYSSNISEANNTQSAHYFLAEENPCINYSKYINLSNTTFYSDNLTNSTENFTENSTQNTSGNYTTNETVNNTGNNSENITGNNTNNETLNSTANCIIPEIIIEHNIIEESASFRINYDAGYDYWIEYSNKSNAKRMLHSDTKSKKSFTPKSSLNEMDYVFFLYVRYFDNCTNSTSVINRTIIYINKNSEKTGAKECDNSKSNHAAASFGGSSAKLQVNNGESKLATNRFLGRILNSFYTLSKKKSESYNYFFTLSDEAINHSGKTNNAQDNKSSNYPLKIKYAYCSLSRNIQFDNNRGKAIIYDGSGDSAVLLAYNKTNGTYEILDYKMAQIPFQNNSEMSSSFNQSGNSTKEENTSSNDSFGNMISAGESSKAIAKDTGPKNAITSNAEANPGKKINLTDIKEYVLPAAIIGLLGYSLLRNLKAKYIAR